MKGDSVRWSAIVFETERIELRIDRRTARSDLIIVDAIRKASARACVSDQVESA